MSYEQHSKQVDMFAKRVVQHLDHGTETMEYDITERLRAARERALSQRKRAPVVVSATSTAPARMGTTSSGAAMLGKGGNDHSSWWQWAISGLAIMGMVFGLITISVEQDNAYIQNVAEVDAQLLTDDLPPQAYTDPGFVQFLKVNAQ